MTDPWLVDEVSVVTETVFVTVDNVTDTLVIDAGPVVSANSTPQQKICDMISSVEAYIGYADPGALTSEPVWHICHVVDTAEGPRTTWARSGSGTLFDLIWDDRLSYTWPS